jgi:WD40 repeat protein
MKGGLAIWKISDRMPVAVIDSEPGPGIGNWVAISRDGAVVAAANKGGVILWDWKAGTSRQVLEVDAATTTAIALSPDGKLVAAATGNTMSSGGAGVRVWDLQANRVRSEWRCAGQMVSHMVFSPDSGRLATGSLSASQQGLLKLWDTGSGREVFSAALPPTMVTAIAFSPDGRRLAAATQVIDAFGVLSGRKQPGDIYVWDASPAAGQRP